MKLTWRDAATVPFMTAIIALYIAHLRGVDGWLIASTRGNATAILVLGTVGGCALGSANDLFQGARTSRAEFYAALAALLGFTALAAGLVTLIAASAPALAVLFGATMALWVLSTARHLFATTTMPGAELGPDTHEVIEQPPVRH
jgi:branched-subunit amino acid permease